MLSLVASCDKANIFLGLIEFELNSLLGASTIYQFIFDSTLKDICKICGTTFHQLTSVAHFSLKPSFTEGNLLHVFYHFNLKLCIFTDFIFVITLFIMLSLQKT